MNEHTNYDRQHKPSEEEWCLQAQNEWFRVTLSSIGDGVIATDTEGRVRFLNPVAQALTGWTKDEAEGAALEEVFQIISEETRRPVENPVAKVLRENTVIGLANHTLLIRKDGSEIAIADSASPIRNPAGGIIGVVLVFRDVTKQRRAEIAIRDAKEYAENIVDTLRHPLLVLDGDLRVQTANRAFYRAFHVSPEETKHQLLHDLGNGQWNIPKLSQLLTEILLQNTSFEDFEVEHDFPDIGHRFMRLNARRILQKGNSTELILLAIEDVTEQRRAEDARREIETRFTSLVKNIKDHSIFTMDATGHITSWNREAEYILRFSEQEALGQHFSLIFTSEDVEQGVPEHELETAQKEGRAEDERWHRRKDGELFWALGIVTPTMDADGTHTGFSKILRDMTDRKRAEEELRDARSLLESTLTAGEVGTWDWDVVNERMFVDQNLAAMFGASPEDAASGRLEMFMKAIHPEDLSRVENAIRKAIEEGGSNYEVEYRLIGPGDKIRCVIARGRVERDQIGRAVRLPGVVIDITERIESEQKVHQLTAESERQRRVYETALSNTADFNYIFDLEGRFIYINRALLELWGKTFSEAVGKNFFELGYPPELAALLYQQIRRVIATKQPLKDETSYTSAQGTRQYEYIFVPVLGAKGEVEAVTGSTRDITERKELEHDLRQLAADLSESDRRKTEFLATLGHELRNPLAPIRTGLELMKLVADDPVTMEETRRMMEGQAQQMVRLIDDLLDVSRITQGKLTLQICRSDLAEIVRNAVEASRPFIEEAGHHLTVTLPEQPIYVDADPNRLAQVFSNLLNNSSKYTPNQGRIWLIGEQDGSDVIITVQDDGIGIPAEMQSGIFEMFNQIDRPLEQSHKGLGIGLTLVKQLVEMHGGKIEVQSEGTNKGSLFKIRLPILVNSPTKKHQATREDVAVTTTKLRILVVDDNRAAADMLSLVVKMLGNEVRTASDGQEAVEIAEKFLPHVVLMDLGMLKMNGYEAALHIRKQPWGAKMMLVALTGWGQAEDKQRTKVAGFDYHLVKPAEPDELQKLLAMAEAKKV